MINVLKSTALCSPQDLAYNEFGYNEHSPVTNIFLCIKTVHSNEEKFDYNEHWLTLQLAVSFVSYSFWAGSSELSNMVHLITLYLKRRRGGSNG